MLICVPLLYHILLIAVYHQQGRLSAPHTAHQPSSESYLWTNKKLSYRKDSARAVRVMLTTNSAKSQSI